MPSEPGAAGPGQCARRGVRSPGGGSTIAGLTETARDLPTTSGVIAVANLGAQIDGLTARLSATRSRQMVARSAVTEQVSLLDLLLLRGHVLGRIADYEWAAGLAETLVGDAPDDGTVWLARARTRATFHRFPEGLADLDAAERLGADRTALDAERATILQAVGCSADALALRRDAAERRPDITTLGALAVLQAERGGLAEAEGLFAEAQRHYRDVSPFPVADLDYRRGLMWLGRGHLRTARVWFGAVLRRVPAHAPAQGHLAEVDAALGAHEPAIDRLRPLTVSSDDPVYAAALAGVLRSAGRPQEAEVWRVTAAASYHELVARHPEAFAHHAADFWLTVGGDRSRGLRLLELDRANRCTTTAPSPLDHTARAD